MPAPVPNPYPQPVENPYPPTGSTRDQRPRAIRYRSHGLVPPR